MVRVQPSLPIPSGSLQFGVATADHQCEAYDPLHEDIRDVWESRLHLTARGRATDFWNRYAEDIELARALGCKLFRFSLAWSRLEPTPGVFSEEAFAHYQQVLETVHAAGMTPLVTLHHFTWPLHVEERGGLVGEHFPALFVAYVDEVMRRLGHLVHYWLTFNEPSQLVYGYIKPWWIQQYAMPPGLPAEATLTEQIDTVGQLMRNLFLAHTRARSVIKQSDPTAQVGVNPLLLGLPAWLQRLVDFSATRIRKQEHWRRQGRRFGERGLLEQGSVDVVLATLTATAERARQVDFSTAYYAAAPQLLTLAESPLHQVQDFKGQVLVATAKSVHVHSSIVPGAQLRFVKTEAAALQCLERGEAAALLSDNTLLSGLMQRYPGRYRLIGDFPATEMYVAAVAKGNSALLHVVNQVIQQSKRKPDWTASQQRYFPDQPVPEPPQLPAQATLADINQDRPGPTDGAEAHQISRQQVLLERIKRRGYLIVAVKEDVPGLGYRAPATGKLSGLEIELARAIAQQILGDPEKVVFRPVKTGERLARVRSLVRLFDGGSKLFSTLSSALTSNWWHLGMAGKLPAFLCPAECVGQQDFIGFDYYWGISSLQLHRVHQLLEAALGRYDQAPVWPAVLYRMLKYHARLFPGRDILLIENGCVQQADGMDRATYLRKHIQQVRLAQQAGVPVLAYTCWSITSNREWGLKFGPSSDFGLYHIELDTDSALQRTPTPASTVYRQCIQDS